MEEELKKYGLKVYWRNANPRHNSDDPDDYEPIDFTIEDGTDNVAWVWGSDPWNDVQIECDHPVVEFDDDEPTGECMLCGAKCDCHYEADEGNVEDYAWSGRELVPTEWTMPKKPGGIIGDYLKDLQKRW